MSEQNQETVTFTLNEKEVTVPKGWTVMMAAEREGVKIPHFCWHPGLSIAGVCRFCMVKVEGRPKLEVACNLTATDGLVVTTETEDVKEAHKWALEFHLVNHPLDCPICDQAGECELQNYYMSVGKYDSQMNRPKVLKPKALDVGGDLVLDTERCILCSRCVRFEEEVTKTNGLGIFDRGDRAMIGIYEDNKIDHNYTANLVDICPVGAFTSKDFRFKQRVWFLDSKDAICPGCSTGCAVTVHGKPKTNEYFRIKPRYSEVNDYWMCDKGRHLYEGLNAGERQRFAMQGNNQVSIEEVINQLRSQILNTPAKDIAILVSPHYTNEELEALLGYLVKEKGITNVYPWRDPSEDRDAFDGLLLRGDRNPNTMGLQKIMESVGLKPSLENGFDNVIKSGAALVIALAPEFTEANSNLTNDLQALSELENVSMWTTQATHSETYNFSTVLPMLAFSEKVGHYLNYNSTERHLSDPFPKLGDQILSIQEIVERLK